MSFDWREWFPGTEPIVVSSDEALCFRARLDGLTDPGETPDDLLSPDELDRAARFMFPWDRRRFVLSHALLRMLIGACIGSDSRSVSFERGPFGKPILARRLGASRLRFNMSVSHDVALYAFARGREVGVDVEYRDDELADALLASRVLPGAARDEIVSQPHGRRTAAFYDRWTRLEALGKAEGWGLVDPMEGRRAGRREWTLFECAPEPAYSASLAVEGKGVTLMRRTIAPVPSLAIPR